MNNKYSVLMSVYRKENPEFLEQSMMSIYYQTVPTDDFVLICDGPLTKRLDKTIDEMRKLFGKRLRVIRCEKNHGLGEVLNLGLPKCKNDIVVRMDSDDVSRSDRCEKELKILQDKPEISVVGSLVAEFEEDPAKPYAIRRVPETQEEILKFVRLRSPMNHPSVMFRKKDILAVGGYPKVRRCQDYYLWEKMLARGYKLYNIQETLVYMREDRNTFRRRSGLKYFMIQKRLFKQMKADKLLPASQYYGIVTLRFCSAIAPNWVRQIAFKKFMREEIK